jgi:hypothetical protein
MQFTDRIDGQEKYNGFIWLALSSITLPDIPAIYINLKVLMVNGLLS